RRRAPRQALLRRPLRHHHHRRLLGLAEAPRLHRPRRRRHPRQDQPPTARRQVRLRGGRVTAIDYDLEFLEDSRTIELISIGMVCDDGREYYAVNRDMPVRKIRKHKWLMENVVPGLPKGHGDMRNSMSKRWLFHYGDHRVKRRERIADEVMDFIRAAGPDVKLWANYGAYDHVCLAHLWGRMIDLPEGVPM